MDKENTFVVEWDQKRDFIRVVTLSHALAIAQSDFILGRPPLWVSVIACPDEQDARSRCDDLIKTAASRSRNVVLIN